MKQLFAGLVLMIIAFGVSSFDNAKKPLKILVFSKTMGFHHASIPAGVACLQKDWGRQ